MSKRQPASAVAPARPVRVAIRADVPMAAAWSALADPARLGMWFGDLDGPWRAGGTGRIDFGDGDFFVVTTREVVEDALVRFEWSFLGAGPPQLIEWRVSAVTGGVEIVVEDHDPGRAPAEVAQMRAGWNDFFGRLARHLVTGDRTRYQWREEIDGYVEVTPGAAPLRPDVLYQWLPIASDGFRPRWFFVVDADGPRRFAIEDWQLTASMLTFSVVVPGSANATRARVAVDPQDGRRLRFSHTGWRELGLPDLGGRELRSRFAAAWTAALVSARKLGSAPGPDRATGE